jgi:mutual gliding-motility protein MglA
MAYFDESSGEVVLRIVYDGLGTAGKTTNLRSLYAAFSERASGELVISSQSRTGRTLYFDWLELAAGHFDLAPLRVQLLSVPGQFVYATRRFSLLQQLDGAVLVCESTERGAKGAKTALTFLRKALQSSGNADAPLVVQANKQDLPGALPVEDLLQRLDVQPHAAVPASALNGDGVRATLLRVLDLARWRLRTQLAGAPVSTLPPCTQTIHELYRALANSGDVEADAAFVEALESALAEVVE